MSQNSETISNNTNTHNMNSGNTITTDNNENFNDKNIVEKVVSSLPGQDGNPSLADSWKRIWTHGFDDKPGW